MLPAGRSGPAAAMMPIAAALKKETDMLNGIVAGDAPPGLMIWRTGRCLVAPRSFARNPGFSGARAQAAAAGWPIHLRDTGGDVTPQGPTVINVSMAYVPPAGDRLSIAATYERLCRPILDTLDLSGFRGGLGAINGAFCDGAYNVNIEDRKFAGTAQRWRKTRWDRHRVAVFSHAALLMEGPGDEAIEAINNFYKACGLSRRILRDAHIGLLQASPSGVPQLTPRFFIAALRARYATQIEALTSEPAPPPVALRRNGGKFEPVNEGVKFRAGPSFC